MDLQNTCARMRVTCHVFTHSNLCAVFLGSRVKENRVGKTVFVAGAKDVFTDENVVFVLRVQVSFVLRNGRFSHKIFELLVPKI